MKTSFATHREGRLRHECRARRVRHAGLCADLFAHALLERDLLVGETVIRELRSKLRIKLRLSKHAIDEIEALLRDQVVVSTPKGHLDLDISDADDEWIVAEAMAGEAPARVDPMRRIS